MGQQYESINERWRDFITAQKIFFVATAASEGRVNLSPKGMDTLRVLDENRVAWLNLTGSGNETAAHLRENDRMTLMFCAFEGNPVILRLYGHATAVHPRETEWRDLVSLFPAIAGARQIIDLRVDLVLTSCGMAVPFFKYEGERDELNRWAEQKGDAGIRQYWADHNQSSLDGKPTDILDG